MMFGAATRLQSVWRSHHSRDHTSLRKLLLGNKAFRRTVGCKLCGIPLPVTVATHLWFRCASKRLLAGAGVCQASGAALPGSRRESSRVPLQPLRDQVAVRLRSHGTPAFLVASYRIKIESTHLRKDWQIIVMLVPCDPHIPRQNCMTHINATTSFHDHLHEHNSHTNCLCGRRKIANSSKLRTRSAKTCSKT